MNARPANDAGFSLVEVLVVLALVAALATSLTLATSQFGKLLQVDDQTQQRLALHQAVRHVTELLEQVEDIPVLTATDREPIRNGLLGKPSEVRFIALARRGALLQGLRETTLRVEGGEPGMLVQLMSPRRLEPQPPQNIERIELANDVTELSLLYFGTQGEAQTPAWHDEWLNIEALPLAVSVKISVRKGATVLTATDVATLNR